MNISTKLLKAAAGATAAGGSLDVDSVFSTFLYAGDGNNAREINNGIDLSGEGGMVWFKARTTAQNHRIFDTARGSDYSVITNSSAGQSDHGSGGLNSFDDDGFTLGNAVVNGSGIYGGDYTSWTWRKATNWFDIVQYTGNNATQTINHYLGSVPGLILVKRLDDAGNWGVKHRSIAATNGLFLNQTDKSYANSTYWGDTEPTSTQFTVGTTHSVSGASYVAYLFAHHANDGSATGFGPNGDSPVISCGSISGYNGRAELGFEPQWVLLKSSNYNSTHWIILDNMRRWTPAGSNDDAHLWANLTNAEADYNGPSFDATGFNFGQTGDEYVYMAVRRGSLFPPEAGNVDDVFDVDTVQASSGNQPAFKFNFVTDFLFSRQVTATQDWLTNARLLGQNELKLNSNGAQSTNTAYNWDYMDGAWDPFAASPVFSAWGWKRAPGFFDVQTWSGDGVNGRQIPHGLTVQPEMIWVKRRSGVGNWTVYAGDATDILRLNTSDPTSDADFAWNDTAPTASVFTVGNHNLVNGSGETYIAVLFSSLAGISKCGSYTGNGTSQTIDCGFSNGARLVLVKQSSGTGSWFLFDYGRSIVAGNDSLLQLNSSGGEYTGADYIDPDSSGFIAVGDNNNMNTNGETFFFYAIAA